MVKGVGKLTGSSGGEDESFIWWYYFCFPVLILARTAQFGYSLLKFLVGLMIGDATATAAFLCGFWHIYVVGFRIWMECLAVFRWIVWMHTYFELKIWHLIVGMQYAFIKSIWPENTFSGYIDKYKQS